MATRSPSSSNSADGGSGVASAQFQRSPAGAGTWTNIGAADTTSPYSVNWDTTAVADGLYDLRVITTDNVGNTFTSALVTNVRVDNTLPTNTLSLQSPNPAGSAFQNGNTIYYRGTAAGNFQLQNAVADAGSGPASAIFPALGGTVGTWTHTTQTVNTPAGGPYLTTNNFAWNAGETNSPTESATGTDAAGNTSNTTVLTFTNDSTNPSVTAPSVGAGYYTSLSVPVTLNGGSDGGSGVASGSSVVQRDDATLSGGSCGSFSGSWTTIVLSAGNDTSVQNSKCYEYRERLTDNVGNVGSSSASAIAKVDNVGPSNALTLTSISPAGSVLESGNTIYYRGAQAGGGSFKIRNAVSDPESDAASSQTAALGGSSTGWTHTPSTVATPAGGPFDSNDFAWSQGTTSAPTEVVTGRDGAANATVSATLTFANDSNDPTGGALTVNGTAASGGGSASYDSDGTFTIGTRSDYSETQTATESGLATSTLVRTSASFSSADVCGAFASPTTIVGNPAQNGLATGCYRYTLTGTDNVGNTTSIQTTVKVDTSDPSAPTLTFSALGGGAYYPGSGTRVYFKPDAANGTFDLTASSSDSDTGVASYGFPAGSALGSNWSGSGSGATRTYSYTATATSSGTQSVGATNNAGRSASSSFDPTADSSAPTGGALTVNGTAASGGGSASYDSDGTFTIGTRSDYSETQTATESGLATSTLVRTSASFSSADVCGAFASPTTIVGNPAQNGLATGCYRYTLTGTDNVGNTTSIQTTVKVDTSDPSAPTLTFSALGGGAYYPGSGTRVYFKPDAANGTFDLTASSSDSDTGVASYGFPAGSALGSNWSGSGSGATRTYSYTATATSSGTQSVGATNNAGRSASSSFDPTADSSAPTGGALTVNGTAASGGGSASYDSDGTFTIGTRSDYSETQTATESGLATSTLVRTSASFSSADVCGAFASPTTIVGNPAQNGLATGCYRYTLTGTDNVGNTTSIQTTVKVDTSDPSAPTLTFSALGGGAYYPGSGTRVYFKPDAANGTFDLTASSSDSDTGVASYGFPAGSALGSNWSGSGSGATRTYSYTATATSSGTQSVGATNNAGRSASSSFDPTADSSAPTGGALTVNGTAASGGGSASYDSDGTFTIGTRSDYSETQTATESGLATSTLVRTSASFSSADVCGAFASPTTIVGNPAQNGLATGCYRYTLTGTDNVGNTTSIQTTVKVDTDSPSVSLTDPGTPLAGTVSLAASASDASTDIQQVVFERAPAGGSTWTTIGTDSAAPYTTSWNTGSVADGDFDLRAVATDNAGNSNTSLVANRHVDNTPPNSTIDTDPADPSNNTTPTFTFSSSETGSTFECRIDGGSWTTCSSPDTLAPLSAGSHTFDLRATDAAGNTDPTPASYTWTIDVTSPNTTIDTNPADPSNNTTPTFTFSSSETGSTFECRIDGGSWTTCSSPDTLAPLSAGSHTFDLRATDAAGNTDPTPASYTWTIDVTSPNTTIDTNPADPSNNTTPTFTFSSSETGSTFECRIDGGSWTTCSSPDTLAPLSAGSHTFDLRATDAAGNTDPTPASYTWTIDVTSPNTTIDTNPADPSNNTTPTFTFSSSETGSTFECRIDGGSWTTCSSPDTLAPLSAGSHTFDLRATDAAGNTDPTPASYTWTIDVTPPNTTIDTNPADPSNNTTPTFTFSSSETGSTFECRIDGGSWTTCSSPDTLAPLSAGSHTFDLRATDAAGNTDPTPASYTWTIDVTSPTVTITDPTAYLNDSDPNNYSVAASTPDPDVARVDFFECSDASAGCATGTWIQFGTDNSAPYGATWSTPAFDGPKAVRAVAVDAAANTGQHVRTITIDRTAPSNVSVTYPNGYVVGSYAITTSNGPDSDVNAASGSLERQTGNLANDACSSYSGWVAATSPDTLASGKCAQYRYSVADNAGNVALATSADEVKADTAAPTTTLADPGANLRQTITLGAGASDTDGSGVNSVAFERRPAGGGSWTTIATDGGSPYSVSFDTTTVADGLYDFRSVATDVAGNVETSPSVVANRRIDNTAPSATMLSPGDPVGGTVALTSNTSDTGGSGIATVSYELAPNGGSFNSQPASWDTTLLSDGLYDLRVIATDVAGNTKTSPAVTTRVDNTPPALNFTSPATGSVVSGTVSLVGSATDASPASPPITFAYKLHSDPPSAYAATGSSWNTASLPAGDGLYDLRARATDDAANTTNVENTSIRVDNAPPTVAITAPATAINGSLPSPTTFAANASDPAGSGVSQVEFFECTDLSNDCSSGVWSPLGTVPAPGPYSVSWAIPAADGNHALAAVATDNAGHTATAIRNVDVDRTAPNTSIVTKPADPSNGTPSFTFTSTEPGSTFECKIDGGGFAPCTSPHTVPGLTDNSHTLQVRATDTAGNTDATPDSWTWHRDTNAPSSTLNNPGSNVRQVVTLTSAENDPPSNGYQSGIASVAFEYSANGTTWASIGTNTSPPFNDVLWNTALVADGVYQLRIIVSDAAGNSTTDVLGSTIRIDNTPPTTSQNDPGQYLRTTKTLTGSASDAGSGIDHVDFERAPTGGGSWTTIATDSTPGDGFQASFDTTSVSDGHYDFRTVAYDVAGNQAAATPVADRLVDNTPPDATLSSPGPYLRGAVNLTSSTSDPGGSNASGVVTVAYEYSTNGGSTWQSTGSNFNSSAVPDGNVDLRVVATDAAGNVTASAPATSLVDNTKPSTTDNAPSGWQSTPVTVTLNPNDGGSGVNVTEYSVDGNPSYTVGTSVVIPAPADGSNDGSHTIAYFSVDNAGNIETIKSTTVLIDATPPTCASCSAADYLRGTVDLSADPDTTGSGIKSVTFEYTDAGGSTWTAIGTDTTGPGPYTASWDTTLVPDGHYDLRILITDNADNVTTTDLPDKVVDNTAPDVALVGAPTEGQLVSGTIGIAASASDATSPVASVKFYVRGSLLGTDSTAPFSLNWNTTTGADGAATIQVVVEDMAGNTTTSAVRNVSVDNVSPTPTLADPGQYLNGTVSLSASSDPDTTQVDFERRTAGGGSWVTIASDTTTPWGTSLDTTALADGLYDFRAIATDATGHTGTSPIRANVRVDNTSPAGSLTSPAGGATVGGPSVTLSGSYSDAGSGIASVRYELRPTGGGSWTTIATSTSAPFSATWDATTVASGSYDLQPVLTDRAGNTFTGAMRTITVDVSAPTVVLANPGATISGSVTLNATVTGSGATQVAFATSPAGGASWSSVGTDTSAPWSATFNTSLLPDGVYDIRATVSDSLGNTSFDTVTSIRVDNTAPRVVSSTPAEGSTVSSANAIGLVTSEPATPLNVTLDGGATVAPVVSGTHIDFGTGTLSPGAHTLSGELQDSSGKRAPFRVHFTVWSPSGSSLAPPVNKNTSAATSTTVESADGFAAATMPAGAWSTSGADWLILRITPVAAPSGLTNGFGSGPEALDVTARWALAGTEVHQFNRPIGILMRTTEKGLVPATFENGQWRVIARVPSAGTLPAGWDDGFWTDGAGFHLLTRHLSVFALLHDLQAPNAPQNVRGYLGPTGLTLRWTPGSDNSGTYDFVTVFSDSTDTGHYGVDYTTASIGSWSVGDPRIFRLKETDLAGNESALTRPLRPVPSLIGKTPDQVAALLAPLGLSVGSITYGGTGPAGTVTGPANLVLAEEGGSIDLIVSQGGAGTRLAFKVVTAPRIKPAKRRSIGARVMVTRASRVTAQLFSPRRVKLYTWRFSVKAGRTIVKLRLPRQVRRTGVYTMRWTARSGRETVARKLTIRLVRTRARSTQPVQVLLAGGAATSIRGNFTLRKGRVVSSASIEPTFDAAANRRTDVHVIVVDVDQFGVGLISDLHAVFPSAKLVALTSSPRQMVNSLRAGASIALPRSTPASTLVRVIQRLLGGPAKPVRSRPAKRHTAGGSRS